MDFARVLINLPIYYIYQHRRKTAEKTFYELLDGADTKSARPPTPQNTPGQPPREKKGENMLPVIDTKIYHIIIKSG